MSLSRPARSRHVMALGVVGVAGVLAVAVVAACGGPGSSRAASGRPAHHHARPTTVAASTQSRTSVPQVGPLFPNGLDNNHTCTASVVASRTGATILTAAHCLSGPVDRILFVPGYREKKAPFGVWKVTAAYVPTGWSQHQRPADDFAVLTVANRVVDRHSVTLASVVGAERVGVTPRVGTAIRIAAYNNGRGDDPLTCATQLSMVRGHPTFFCHGFVGGSSGSPWLTGTVASPVVVGVIGGRHQGGCTEFVSHSPVFGSAVAALVARAARGGPADDPPSAGSDNCPAGAA